jgi:hypothetical protein
MATGYAGIYKAVVVDNVDPMVQNRLMVTVPDLGIESAWAKPQSGSSGPDVPALGEEVFVQFEGGDSDHPVWRRDEAAAGAGGAYVGVYPGTVINNVDPTQSNRLEVQVPDVPACEAVWATASASLGTVSELPAVGSAVWVQFDNGDPAYPQWVGVQ